MRNWFESLEQREQLFVATGAVVVALALFWALVWLPLERGQQSAAESVAAWQESLAELKPLRAVAAGGGQRPAVTTGQTPVVVIDQTLRARGLDRSLRRSQPTTSTGIRVDFENVAFDDLVLWLGDLSSQHGMDVQAGSFSRASQAGPGRVDATLTLERSP